MQYDEIREQWQTLSYWYYIEIGSTPMSTIPDHMIQSVLPAWYNNIILTTADMECDILQDNSEQKHKNTYNETEYPKKGCKYYYIISITYLYNGIEEYTMREGTS